MISTEAYNFPTAIVVFGGTGDLAQTKLFPALFDLYRNNALPKAFTVIGLSRKKLTDSAYQDFVYEALRRTLISVDDESLRVFSKHFRYTSGSFDSADSYEQVKKLLSAFDERIAQCTNKLFYLAVPPEYYETIFDHLHSSQAMALCDNVASWSRLLVEKPFGKDLTTALALEKKLCELFSDDQIYRIDHYLAKDAIENIISLRFANSIIADSWNKERIESIAIRLLETKDVSNRGSFYDGIGTLRDVGQNHMLQIFALLTMSKVDVQNAHSVREARTAALEMLSGLIPQSIVRGQYEGFVDTKGVDPHSQTETYFKLVFTPKSTLWKEVQFILEAGKVLDRSFNEAVVTFRSDGECHCAATLGSHNHNNVLKIVFAPEQTISLSMWVKKPGFTFELEERELVLLSQKSTETHSPEAYERVLFDCIAGDQTRFVSGAEVSAAWKFITPILDAFSSLPLQVYQPGSTGPQML